MTNKERMEKGLIYDPGDKSLLAEQLICMLKLWRANRLSPLKILEKDRFMKKNFAECGKDCYIELPLRANWGGKHVHFGDRVYANFNLTLVDDGHIYVGSYTMIGPNVTIATAAHPIEPSLRKKNLQYNRDVHIGENVWIGANVVVCPGVSIGENSVIGAGSVVTKDIPPNVVAVGNPCRVLREIGERDREYYYKDDKINWENL